MNERELEETLRSLRDEPVDEALAAAVRASALSRIRRERRRPWLTLAGAIAAALIVAIGLARLSKPVDLAVERPRKRSEIASTAKPPERAAQVAQRRTVARNRAATVRERARRPVLAPEPMTIQMLTDDPDLVIIWLVGDEDKGDME